METLIILKTYIFCISLFCTVYFTCKFTTWLVWKTNPEKFGKSIERIDIIKYNATGLIALLGWTTLYCLSLFK